MAYENLDNERFYVTGLKKYFITQLKKIFLMLISMDYLKIWRKALHLGQCSISNCGFQGPTTRFSFGSERHSLLLIY